MMSQIGSPAGALPLVCVGIARFDRLEIFMSAMLTYFSFIVTQSHGYAKRSYRAARRRRSALNRPRKRALMVRAATYRQLGRDAKAAQSREIGREYDPPALEERYGGAFRPTPRPDLV
jgi:hypothetical protein